MTSIGNEVKKLMIDKDMSKTCLASKLDIGRSTLYKKLNGGLDFNRKEISIMRKEFDLPDEEVVRIFFEHQVS